MDITLLDSSAIGIVMAITAAIRKMVKIPDRYVPLLPVVVSFFVAMPVVYNNVNGDVKNLGVFLVSSMLEGVKIAAASMTLYKVGKTTVLGKSSQTVNGEVTQDVGTTQVSS